MKDSESGYWTIISTRTTNDEIQTLRHNRTMESEIKGETNKNSVCFWTLLRRFLFFSFFPMEMEGTATKEFRLHILSRGNPPYSLKGRPSLLTALLRDAVLCLERHDATLLYEIRSFRVCFFSHTAHFSSARLIRSPRRFVRYIRYHSEYLSRTLFPFENVYFLSQHEFGTSYPKVIWELGNPRNNFRSL